MRVRVLIDHIVGAGVVAKKGDYIHLADAVAQQRITIGYVEPAPAEGTPVTSVAPGLDAVAVVSDFVPTTAPATDAVAAPPDPAPPAATAGEGSAAAPATTDPATTEPAAAAAPDKTSPGSKSKPGGKSGG